MLVDSPSQRGSLSRFGVSYSGDKIPRWHYLSTRLTCVLARDDKHYAVYVKC